MPVSAYDEDCIISTAAHQVGILDVRRVPIINVDERLLPKEYFRKAVDYSKIRRDLGAGVCIPGVEESQDFEYILRRRSQPQEAARIANDLAGNPGNNQGGDQSPERNAPISSRC